MSTTFEQTLTFEESLDDEQRATDTMGAEYVHRGDLLPIVILARAMGTTVESLEESVTASRLFSVPVGDKFYLPSFYGEPGVARQDLELIIPWLKPYAPWTKFVFFTSRKISLGGSTPVQALRRGDLPSVLRAVRSFSRA
jgi:hypothetical protein